ncbi:unnamed protein product [Paramecium octaurelia]|uniref:Transmembrane protein n=1 Tax=Paramecium octaurelia TaxID=43137 RepID=A0A8S1VQX8_PAROT|nr:unnamed protein product [Paramecium octaurelia]
MQPNVYMNEIRKEKEWLANQRQEILQKKEQNKLPNGEFEFKPPKTIEDQLEELQQQCLMGLYDKKITIKGYKGTFKLEHWKMIELRQRGNSSIQQIRFIDTKLEKENLMILPLWFSWVKPQNLVIEFQHNELDDQCVEEFIFQIFERNINLQKMFLISNPGVYKGFLLRKLKHYLVKKYENNMDYYYLLLKNKFKLSFAIIKIYRNWQVQKIREERELALKKIDQTYYFSFNLSKCFTQINWKGFEHLIRCTYSFDNLEQISSLDISDNYLGTQSSFNNACQSLATAKGLVTLKLKNQPLFHNTTAIQQLIGDRYDRLRINHLDISDNSDIFEKAFQLLADDIFLECKTFNLNNSLTENNSTLYKLSILIQAFERQNNLFEAQEKSQKSSLGKYKYKSKLQSLDLSKVENFNRYDQIEALLKTVVFSEYSNVRTHTIQNLDVGRTEIYCKALNQFKSDFVVRKSKIPKYKDFKLNLKHLVLIDTEQEYTMKIDVLKQFFLDYLFTKEKSLLQIESFKFIKSFTKKNRKEAFKLAAAYILEAVHKNPNLQFSINKLKFFSAQLELDLQTFKCLLLIPNIKLRVFKYFKDSMKGDGNIYLNELGGFLYSQPESFVHSLQILKLDTITGISFDVSKLIKLLIYCPKLQIKEFYFYKIKLTKSSLSARELELHLQNSVDPNRIIGLRSLKFGDFQEAGEEEFFKYIVFSKLIRLKELILKNIDFNQLIQSLQASIIPKNMNPLEELQILEFEDIYVQQKELWNQLSKIFIFQNKKLVSLTYNSINVDLNFNLGMTQSAAQYISQAKSSQQKDDFLLPITELKFIECNLNSDFLSYFFPIAKIEKLEIYKCKNVQTAMLKVKENYIDEINQFALKQFTLKNCELTDMNLFEWMVNYLILNIERQQLDTLNLINCNLNDDMIIIICKQLQQITSKIFQYKRIFSLRHINFSQNDKIKELQWINLFNTILNQNQTMQYELVAQDSLRKDEVNVLINENLLFVDQTLLNLKQKLYYNHKIFKPNFPKQLKKLEIDLGLINQFKNQNNESNFQQLEFKRSIYQRIITGFIIYPESQLKKLKLSNVDLDLFMLCCNNSIEFSQKYLELSLTSTQKQQFINIEQIHIHQVTTQSRISIEQFFKLFLFNHQVNLKKLSIHGFREQFLQIFLNLSECRTNYVLEQVSFENCEDKLNESQTQKFIEQLIVGKVFPIKKITIPKGVIFDQIKQFDLNQANDCKIEKIKLSIEDKGRNHMSTIHKIFSLLFCQLSNLKKLEITTQIADSIFQHIYEVCKAEKLKLESLIINGQLSVDMDFFHFIFKSVETLTLLKIQKVIYLKQNDTNNLLQQIYKQPIQGSVIDLNIIEHEDTYFLYYNLIFNEMFGFTNLVLRDPQSFANLQLSYSIFKIRYLKLDMGINYNSNIQLDNDALTLISSKMIYSEDSILEELVLMNCDLRVPAVKAIVSPAEKLRDRISYSSRQKSFYMSIKRICLLFSFHIGQEGMDILFNNLIYFEYVNIERIELQAIELDDKIVIDMIKHATDWLHFQKRNQRQFGKIFPIRYLDIGKNELFQDKAVWQKFLRTFVFTDKTPYLEILNLHMMALNDSIATHIGHNAQKFLNSKAQQYRFPLKRLNFSKNNFLTEIGWENIFNNFIFHPKVNLIELNLTSTQLDTDEKLNKILLAAQRRAQLQKNKKLPLHTFLCYNVTLKDQIAEYISPMPSQYKPPDDLPIKIDYKGCRLGIFDEIPIHLGDQVEILNQLIYNRNELIIPNRLDFCECFKFSKFHLNFIEHYLKIINHLLGADQNSIELTLNLATLNSFSNLFRYTTEKPAKPFPYFMLFQREAYIFLSKSINKIKNINLIKAESQSLEELNQFDVLQIWENVKYYKCNVDQILMEYTLNDDLVEKMLQKGYTERDVISLCRLIPPSNVRIQGTLSIQAIKGLYSILYDTYYFQYSVIDYKFDNFLNIGIGYGLRETAYRKVEGSSWSNLYRMIQYNFYDIFVKPTQKYVFDDQVVALNQYLSKQKLNLLLLVFTNFLFFGAAIVAPFFLIEFATKENEQQCQVTTSYQQYYYYAAFAVISALIEGYLYFSICEIIPEYITQMEHALQFNESEIKITQYKQSNITLESNRANLTDDKLGNSQFKYRYRQKIEKSYKSFLSKINRVGKSKFVTQINRIIQFSMSQLFKFDLFGDVTFILVLQNCNYNELFYLTCIITGFTQGINFIYFLYLITKGLFQSNKQIQQLSSQFINEFYSIGFLGRNSALSNLLDSIAPYNVSVIPNNKLTRAILPNQAGKSMSNLVKGYFFQFIFEDLPQIVIQTYFTVNQAWKQEGDLEFLTYLRIAISLLTVITSFIRFMSIRPTILVQDDFDKLSDRKKFNYKNIRKDLLQNEKKQLAIYSEFSSHPSNEQYERNGDETHPLNLQQSYQIP